MIHYSSTTGLTEALRNEYQTMFDNMAIHADKLAEVDKAAALITQGKARYQSIEAVTKVPWFFIGLIHYRESTCNFSKHLHNGDPLTARTVNVPAGRPASGNPPFTFEQSAIDALQYQGLTTWKDWSIAGMLFKLEAYNGFGYRNYHDVYSPYLWNYTQYYTKGLYVKDNVFDPEAINKQSGLAPIMRRTMERNNLYAVAATISISAIIIIAGLLWVATKSKGLWI